MDATEAAAGRIEPTRRETVRALGAAMIGNWFDLFDYFSAQIGFGVGSSFSPTNRLLTTSRPVTCLYPCEKPLQAAQSVSACAVSTETLA